MKYFNLRLLFLTFTLLTTSIEANELNERPVRGEEKAEVKIQMYGDFQCPFTRRGHELIKELLTEITVDFSITFHHFPLEFHEHAFLAHKYATCSIPAGKFWDMHDALFGLVADKFNPKNIELAAKKLGLLTPTFSKCLSSKEVSEVIENDLKEAKKLKISGAPTFIIQGPKGAKVVPGAYPLAELKKFIQDVQY
jgi:protein-disulfide isomerase